MIKIISSKKYEKLQQCLVDLQMDINEAYEQNKIYDEQINYLRNKLTNTQNDAEHLVITIEEKNKEIKRLKTLMTKNGISYKKEAKDGTRKKVLHE